MTDKPLYAHLYIVHDEPEYFFLYKVIASTEAEATEILMAKKPYVKSEIKYLGKSPATEKAKLGSINYKYHEAGAKPAIMWALEAIAPKLEEYIFEFDVGSCNDWELYTCNATNEQEARDFIDKYEAKRMDEDPNDEDSGINPEQLKFFTTREATGDLGECDVSVHSYSESINDILDNVE